MGGLVAAPQQRIGDFYDEVVLPALVARLDAAFPEFGWRQDARGWVATNQEMTHRVLGVRADRVVAHGSAPPGFLVHGGETDALDRVRQRRRRSARRDIPVGRARARDSSRSRYLTDRSIAASRPFKGAPAMTSSGCAGASCTARRARPHARISSDAAFRRARSIRSTSGSFPASCSRRTRSRRPATPSSRSRSRA